jgi:hypothetical protein
MPAKQELEEWKTWTTMVSTALVPVVIAGVGYFIQRGISQDSIRKDYVALAVGILTKPRDEKADEKTDSDLRKWAVEVISKNSPVRFDAPLKTQLELGTIHFGGGIVTIPGEMRQFQVEPIPNSRNGPSAIPIPNAGGKSE